MGIVDINKYKLRRGRPVYEELVKKLKSYPVAFYTVQEAEALADAVLKEGGFDGLNGPTPIEAVAEGFGISTYKEANMPMNISGNIYVGGTTKEIYGNDKVIIVGENEEYFHQRFVIAHELEHYLTDYLGNPDYWDKPYLLFSMTYPKKDHDSPKETRADRFAAELLMPAPLFLERYIHAMDKSNCNRRYTISYLSNYFEVKKSSVEKRIKEVFHDRGIEGKRYGGDERYNRKGRG